MTVGAMPMAAKVGLKVRVQGAPIWSRTFAAIGMSPTVIAYNEIYNAIQNGVISAGGKKGGRGRAEKVYEEGARPSVRQHAPPTPPPPFSPKTLKKPHKRPQAPS